MRVKHLWRHFDIPAKASLVWSRITFSRITTIYFIVALCHCFIQVIIQGKAYASNAAASDRLWAYVQNMNMTAEASGFAILDDDLRICYTLPNTVNPDLCTVIWNHTSQASSSFGMDAASVSVPDASTPPFPSGSLSAATSTVNDSRTSAVPVQNASASILVPSSSPSVATSTVNDSRIPAVSVFSSSPATSGTANPTHAPSVTSVVVVVVAATPTPQAENHVEDWSEKHNQELSRRSGPQAPHSNVTCAQSLLWPVQQLSNTKREDITLIGFQIWVFGMSIVALLNESIPHICAALVTQLLVTIWTLFQVTQTEQFRQSFARIITNDACHGMKLLGNYWQERKVAEISSAVLNGVGLLVTALLTYKLTKIYGWQTFKRIGASLAINRIYKLVLSLSIAIQLALFFIVSATALWIDQLCNGAVGRMASLGSLYKAGSILVFCLLIPWLSLGWFSVRREARTMALIFLALSLLFITLWAALFDSLSFRWTFVIWPFFAVMAVVSGALVVITFILGLLCRFNFGKGLPQYLNAEEPLEGEDFVPVYPEKIYDDDPEKVEFPSYGHSVPTFSAIYGKGIEVPKPTYEPGHSHGRSITRSVSSHSTGSMKDVQLTRTASETSHISHSSTSTDIGKRWIIE